MEVSVFAVRLLPNGRWEIVARDDSPISPPWRVYGYVDDKPQLRQRQGKKRA